MSCSRREFFSGASAFALGAGRLLAAPQFRLGAKLIVEETLTGLTRLTGLSGALPHASNLDNPVNPVKDKVPDYSASPRLCVKIPLADGNPNSRVYAYEVVVVCDDIKLHKVVYAAGCNMGIGHEPNGGVTELFIPKSDLPSGNALVVAVRPITSLGTRGKPLVAKWIGSRGGFMAKSPDGRTTFR